MKKIFSLIVFTGIFSCALAQYHPVDEGSQVRFVIKNLGINTKGGFSGLRGNIRFDRSHPEAASFDVSVDASTIDTRNRTRDGHLQKDTYLDVARFPRMHFVSTRVTGDMGSLTMHGRITIKGRTRELSFPFSASPVPDGWMFRGSFRLNRRDFDVGGGGTMAKELEVNVELHAVK